MFFPHFSVIMIHTWALLLLANLLLEFTNTYAYGHTNVWPLIWPMCLNVWIRVRACVCICTQVYRWSKVWAGFLATKIHFRNERNKMSKCDSTVDFKLILSFSTWTHFINVRECNRIGHRLNDQFRTMGPKQRWIESSCFHVSSIEYQ